MKMCGASWLPLRFRGHISVIEGIDTGGASSRSAAAPPGYGDVAESAGQPAVPPKTRPSPAERDQHNIIHVPRYSPSSLGAAERADRETEGQIRALRGSAEEKLKLQFSIEDNALVWLIRQSNWLLTRVLVKADGGTPLSKVSFIQVSYVRSLSGFFGEYLIVSRTRRRIGGLKVYGLGRVIEVTNIQFSSTMVPKSNVLALSVVYHQDNAGQLNK